MIRVNYHLTEKQLDRLRRESGKTGLPVAELIRRAVDGWLTGRKAPKEKPRPGANSWPIGMTEPVE